MLTGRNSSSALFISMRVRPMAKTETSTPMIKAICWLRGVAPTRNPVLRSCEVLPALAEEMHTMPPTESARAQKGWLVQPTSKNTAHVAIRVAIAIPEMGFDEVPIKPVMREETVTNRNPKTTTNAEEKRFASIEVSAPGTGLKVR